MIFPRKSEPVNLFDISLTFLFDFSWPTRYVSKDKRLRFLALLSGVARRVHITRQFQACRDPKDDQFLDVAFSGQAKAILTGDQDLLVLQTFQGIAILTPALFLAAYAG